MFSPNEYSHEIVGMTLMYVAMPMVPPHVVAGLVHTAFISNR